MTKERLPWFPCYPSKLLGAFAGMQPDEGYVYWIVCLRIYEVGGPCPDADDVIARRAGMGLAKVTRALERSFATGRLIRVEGGIMNPFAKEILSDSNAVHESRVEAGRNGGKKSAEKKREKNKQNQQNASSKSQASGKQNPTHLHKHVQLFSNENSTASAESAPADDWPEDYLAVFWNAYPPYRRTAKKTVASKLATIRKSGEVTFARLMDGLRRYCETNPGEYAKGPVVWLNGGCWDDVHAGRRAPRSTGNGFAALLRENNGGEHAEDFFGGGGPIIDAEPLPDQRTRHDH